MIISCGACKIRGHNSLQSWQLFGTIMGFVNCLIALVRCGSRPSVAPPVCLGSLGVLFVCPTHPPLGLSALRRVCSAEGSRLWLVCLFVVFPLCNFEVRANLPPVSDDIFRESFGQFTGLCRSECSVAP